MLSFIAALSIYVTYYLLRLKIPQVTGLRLSKNLVPQLFDTVEEVRAHYGRPSIRDIVVTEKYEIRIERIPLKGLPVFFSNTLVIGLPLLQMLTPGEFRCELSRRIGQYSGIFPRKTLFIARASSLWHLYAESLKKHPNRIVRLSGWLFGLYSRLMGMTAIPASRMEELVADSCAMDFMNENEVLDTLKSESISRAFLELHYWPSVHSMAIENTKIQIRPFAKLDKLIKGISTKESRKKWLGYAFEACQLPGDEMPVLRKRMEGIGHMKIRSIPVPGDSAADKYLEGNKNKVVTVIDKLWCSTTLKSWLKDYKSQRRELERARALSRKSRQQILWPGDMVRYALLARKLNGKPIGQSILKLLKRNMRNSLPSFFANRDPQQVDTGDVFR
ncbi:hypothetical protein [Kaarinaea lacus]